MIGLDRPQSRLYKGSMKTLTITDAKKNLGRWLSAAIRGEEIGIVSGANIVALRKVEVEAGGDFDYGMREHQGPPKELQPFRQAPDPHIGRPPPTGEATLFTPPPPPNNSD